MSLPADQGPRGHGLASSSVTTSAVVLHRFHNRFSQSQRRSLLGPFNQEKALVVVSGIVKTDCETDGSFYSTNNNLRHQIQTLDTDASAEMIQLSLNSSPRPAEQNNHGSSISQLCCAAVYHEQGSDTDCLSAHWHCRHRTVTTVQHNLDIRLDISTHIYTYLDI